MTGPGRTTLYRGIRMRSRLEADFAAWLDREGNSWEYEPVCFAGPAGQWLPDFRIPGNYGNSYIEVKPASLTDLAQIDRILERMEVTWLSEPDAHLRLILWEYAGDPDESIWFEGANPERAPEWMTAWHYGRRDAIESIPWPGRGMLGKALDNINTELEVALGINEMTADELEAAAGTQS